ncbi:MAG: ATP synthase F1 subunit delta [Bacillota bacterium]
MPDRKVTLRYSRALFAAAQRQGRVEPTRLELSELLRALADLPELHTLWYARLPANRKAAAVEAAFTTRLSPLLLRFLRVLVTHRRESHLPDIARSFAALSRKAEKREEAEVVTALPLPPDLQATVVETVARMTGREPEVRFCVDPGLLGGIVLKIGDHVIDASIKGRLKLLRKEILAGEEVSPLSSG